MSRLSEICLDVIPFCHEGDDPLSTSVSNFSISAFGRSLSRWTDEMEMCGRFLVAQEAAWKTIAASVCEQPEHDIISTPSISKPEASNAVDVSLIGVLSGDDVPELFVGVEIIDGIQRAQVQENLGGVDVPYSTTVPLFSQITSSPLWLKASSTCLDGCSLQSGNGRIAIPRGACIVYVVDLVACGNLVRRGPEAG